MHSNKSWRLGILATALALTVSLAGCERTKISDISKNPGRYAGNEVTIAGEVTTTAAEDPKQGTFEVDDGTGRLWVVSSTYDLPEKGARVAVTGLVESGVHLGATSLATVLQETKRRQGGD